jgi:hypothetical protein
MQNCFTIQGEGLVDVLSRVAAAVSTRNISTANDALDSREVEPAPGIAA